MFQVLTNLQKYTSIVNTSEKILFECPVFLKKGESNSKIQFLRFYETFMLLSTCKSFDQFKIASYVFNLSVHFIYSSNSSSTKNLEGFVLISGEEALEFFSANNLHLNNVYRVLKTKLNLHGFHDDFKALKKIGEGSFAKVYMARSNINGQEYAVKAMNKLHIYREKKGFEALQNEIRILRSVDHINLVHLDSVYETPNSFYIVMELFYGGNLDDHIKGSGVLTEEQAAKLTKCLLKGIKYLHSLNIMHRDIKPENLLFRTKANCDENDDVVLADFGLATFNTEERYIFPKCGTPGFVAPEIASIIDPKTHYTLKCDLYSVGVTLYFMLTGHLPYPGQNYLLEENRKGHLDFEKSKIFMNLRSETKEFIWKLVCPVEKRMNVDEALNHRFFTIHYDLNNKQSLEDLCDEENTVRTQENLSSNIKFFNLRKLKFHEKNPFNNSPTLMPLVKTEQEPKNKSKFRLDQSLTFVNLSPLLTGYARTMKSIKNENESENAENPADNQPSNFQIFLTLK